jgi:hypothetical protein
MLFLTPVERNFTDSQRQRLEAEGETGYGTSYPMPDCDAVRRAVQAYGRAPAAHRSALRRAIVARHLELGCTDPLPESWHIE